MSGAVAGRWDGDGGACWRKEMKAVTSKNGMIGGIDGMFVASRVGAERSTFSVMTTSHYGQSFLALI